MEKNTKTPQINVIDENLREEKNLKNEESNSKNIIINLPIVADDSNSNETSNSPKSKINCSISKKNRIFPEPFLNMEKNMKNPQIDVIDENVIEEASPRNYLFRLSNSQNIIMDMPIHDDDSNETSNSPKSKINHSISKKK